jgi:glycopeptide antibiotics resistance protein
VWGLYNSKGEFTTDAVENLILFIPFAILLLWCFEEQIMSKKIRMSTMLMRTVGIVFLFSVSIEFLQLFLRLGTFQLSDMFHNTLGGLVGSLIYGLGLRIVRRKRQRTEQVEEN